MKPANNGPLYASLYPQLAEISRKHGYALAVHGSIASDLDLIAIPWVAEPMPPSAIVDEITNTFCFEKVGELTPKLHGRMVQTLAFAGGGTVYLDLSFMPTIYMTTEEADTAYDVAPADPISDEELERMLEFAKETAFPKYRSANAVAPSSEVKD